jgi:hypothetical protein
MNLLGPKNIFQYFLATYKGATDLYYFIFKCNFSEDVWSCDVPLLAATTPIVGGFKNVEPVAWMNAGKTAFAIVLSQDSPVTEFNNAKQINRIQIVDATTIGTISKTDTPFDETVITSQRYTSDGIYFDAILRAAKPSAKNNEYVYTNQ